MKGIKLELVKSDKTQNDLADYLDVRKETVSRWVNGHNDPSIKTLEKIADYLNCEVVNLLK
jgi:transcriptional regulator with XRE-family HTH domain